MSDAEKTMEDMQPANRRGANARLRMAGSLLALLITWLVAPVERVEAMPQLAAPAAAGGISLGTVQSVSAEPLNDDAADDDGGDDDGGGDGGGSGTGSGDDDEVDYEGFIVTRPEDLIGTWVLQIDAAATVSVTTVVTTAFDPSNSEAFGIGAWVEVEGVLQLNGEVLATKFELDEFEDGELVVRLRNASDAAGVADDYELELVRSLLTSGDIYLFRTTDDEEIASAEQLKSDPRILWAEVNFVNSVPEGDGYKTWAWGGATEPGAYAGQSAYLQAGLGMAAKQFSGDGVVVAILDTGIYTAHEQFQGRLRLPSRDVISDDTDPSEVGPGLAWGHGTHIAGVIAAMAPEATLLPVRVLDVNGRGNTFLLAYAIEWAAAQPGVKVINLSLGTEGNSKILEEVIRRVVDQGIILVAAAGNGGVDTPQYPAAYAGVIGVTAVDENNLKPPFANYGAPMVDLAAPGVGIMSTMINVDGPGYASWSGTSMSTAFVAGAVALLVDQSGAQPLSSAQVLERLVQNGEVLDDENPPYVGMLGRGLNVSGALGVAAPIPSLVNLPGLVR